MRQAIRTRYLGPTDSKGSRVVASCAAGRRIVPWDHAQDPEGNHRLAARLLASRLDWRGQFFGGCNPDGSYSWINWEPGCGFELEPKSTECPF